MLTANDLMTVDPVSVSPETTLRRVIAMMNTEGFRQLPVVANGKLVGIITNRDVRLSVNSPYLHNISERKEFLDNFTVESCMTTNLISVTPDTPAAQVAEMLSLYKYGALPVVENDTLVGIVTVTDMLNYMAQALKEK